LFEVIVFVGLFVVFFGLYVWQKTKNEQMKKQHELDLVETRKDAIRRSRSVIEGQVVEQLVPHFPEWKYVPSEARFLASPLDYVVFSGLSKDNVKEIIFVEVKTNKSQVTKRQKSVREAIKNGKVKYELLEIKDDRKL